MSRESKGEQWEKEQSPFATRLRFLMNGHPSTTQAQLAEITGKTRQTISQYANGISEPGYNTLVKIAVHFHVSIDYLLGRTDTRSPDADIKAVCEFTGLSEKAVMNLKSFSGNSIAFISELIEKSEITSIAVLYEILKHSRKELHNYEQICSRIDKNSMTAADKSTMIKLNKSKEQTEFDFWKLERSIMAILDKMMEG